MTRRLRRNVALALPGLWLAITRYGTTVGDVVALGRHLYRIVAVYPAADAAKVCRRRPR